MIQIDWFIRLVYMSIPIGSFDAKTHLSKYLERVRQGESFLISRNGKAIAELKPVGSKPKSLSQVIDACSDLRRRLAGELSAYDAAYLCVAELHGAVFLSINEGLRKIARQIGISVAELG